MAKKTPKRPTRTRKFVAEEAVSDIVMAGECIIVDPDNAALLIGRWLTWEQYPVILARRDVLRDITNGEEYPPLMVCPSPVGDPIAASSDDAALFELIYSSGGRMQGD